MRISGDCLVEWEKEDVYDGLEEVQMEEEEKTGIELVQTPAYYPDVGLEQADQSIKECDRCRILSQGDPGPGAFPRCGIQEHMGVCLGRIRIQQINSASVHGTE